MRASQRSTLTSKGYHIYVTLYGQDAEVHLLSRLMRDLDSRSVIDVGSERGDLAEKLLQAGARDLHAFEPHPENIEALHTRFDADARVVVHGHAVSDGDGDGVLHVSTARSGMQLPFGHTLLEREDTDEIKWEKTVSVTRRSLGSLVDTGEIPGRVGILKIDTEGHDLAVVRGMGALEAEVVMVEHWTDLPHGLGKCPWTTEEMTVALSEREFNHFAFVIHRGEFVTLKWDDAEVERGAMGNLIFLHDGVLQRLLPDVLDCATQLTEDAVRLGREYVHIADDRLALMDELKQTANDRLTLTEELKQTADDRLMLIEELKQTADDRLTLIEELEKIADDRLALVGELHEVAAERLHALEATGAQLKSHGAEMES